MFALLSAVFPAFADSNWDTQSDTWVAVDGLARKVPTSLDGLSAPKKDRTVGMFYFICNGPHGEKGRPVLDITELIKANPGNPAFGKEGEAHWWGKPVLGYYVNTDPFVYDKHLQMLHDAGVDFLFLDVSNAVTYDDAVETLMKAIDRRTERGLESPKLCYLLNAGTKNVAQHLYNKFYAKPEYDKYWFYYDGKPLMLADGNEVAKLPAKKIYDHFTFRHSWAWQGKNDPLEWSWLEYYPQPYAYSGKGLNYKREQMSVGTAQHATTKVGKSYHDGKQPAIDQYAVCKETPYGLYFEEQWKRAHEINPHLVMITQFNECTAGRFVVKNAGQYGDTRPGGTPKVGESYFVDLYNAEFNRDIEPSTHPLIRDNYYMQLVANVRKYKGVREVPVPSSPRTIDIVGEMSQWDAVQPEFRDDIGDISHRDTKGFNDMAPMVNISGRNDFVVAKVTKDAENMYFYVRTDSDISNREQSDRWMMLLLNTDTDYSTGWNGYDYIAGKLEGKDSYLLLRNSKSGNWQWEEVAELKPEVRGKEMTLSIPRSAIGVEKDVDIDFKWADNVPDNPDILDFLIDGDVAPNGRFNYRYRGSEVVWSGEKAAVQPAGFSLAKDGNGRLRIDVSADSDISFSVYNTQGICLDKVVSRGHESISLQVLGGVLIVEAVTNQTKETKKIII